MFYYLKNLSLGRMAWVSYRLKSNQHTEQEGRCPVIRKNCFITRGKHVPLFFCLFGHQIPLYSQWLVSVERYFPGVHICALSLTCG